MAMAQGYSREDVQAILDDIENTSLITEKDRGLLLLAGKTTRHSYKVTEEDLEKLKRAGCSDNEIFEAIAVTSLFNFMDRMADATGAPVEGFTDMMEEMLKEGPEAK